jgi:hypothetical protein
MRIPFRAGVITIAVTSGGLFGVAAPAHGADPAVLYVKAAPAVCSDSGPGTAAQPFCTIGAAAAVVTAGQTVEIAGGTYPERVTIARSGTAEQPIIFRAAASSVPVISGPETGILIDGQHHIKLENLRVILTVAVPALDVRDSSAITVEDGTFVNGENSTLPSVRLAAVADVLVKGPDIVGRPGGGGGLLIDAASSGVVVDAASVRTVARSRATDGSVGIQVAGSGNTLINNHVYGFGGAAISVESGAAGNVVANNRITTGAGYGVHNRGARGTAVTNNTIDNRCLDGIRVDGASTGVSVQNNVLSLNGHFGRTLCVGGPTDGVEVGIHDGAVGDTVVDYNNAHHQDANSPTIYAWNGTLMGLAAFRTATARATHDRETGLREDTMDAANSAAPGYQATDRSGVARFDDPVLPNTGVGPVGYADRGAEETTRRPIAATEITVDLAAGTVSVDASNSRPGPAAIASYTFSFGDGTTITQTLPRISHRYTQPGQYNVVTTVTGTDKLAGARTDPVSILRTTGTIALLSRYNLTYVATDIEGTGLYPYQTTVSTAGQFDLADAGGGKVALVHRATGKYLSADTTGTNPLTMTRANVEATERFTLIRNADGSISLKADSNGRYVSLLSASPPYLAATGTGIGLWEKFYQVKVSDAARSLKALANGRYVCAENYGKAPLIASRLGVSTWEQFDVVDLGNGQVALLALANRRFVTAQSAGTQPLLARSTAVGGWERFTMIRNSDGTVSLKAAANNRYVSADSYGTRPLIASRTAIKTWEKFTIG